MKNLIQKLVLWSVKHHWIFLSLILFLQWLTGQIMGEPRQWGWIMSIRTARTIHNFLSPLIVIATIALAFDKLFLALKRKGKI